MIPTKREILLAHRKIRDNLKTNDFIMLFESVTNKVTTHYIDLEYLQRIQMKNSLFRIHKHFVPTYHKDDGIIKGAFITNLGIEKLKEMKIIFVVISDE